MGQTSAVDALLVIFNVLPEVEQKQALDALSRARFERMAEAETTVGQALRSLQQVAEHLGEMPNSNTYREAWAEMRAAGTEVDNLTRVINVFGSWRRAREALELSEHWSPRQIDRHRRRRRLDKIWRYTEQTLREAIANCVESIGHVPQVAEFEDWRRQELELRAAEGDDAAHIPSPTPYRRRWGTWEKALLHLGYTPDQVAERLERIS